MGKAPCFGDRALRLSGGFRWAEPHCGCWIWREGSRHTPNPSSTLHSPPPFFSSSLEKCISVKDIQAGSSLHVFCLQPCSSSFTSSCSQLLPRSSGRDLGETLGGRGQEGERTHRQTSTCDKPPPNNGCRLRGRGGGGGGGGGEASSLDGLIGA